MIYYYCVCRTMLRLPAPSSGQALLCACVSSTSGMRYSEYLHIIAPTIETMKINKHFRNVITSKTDIFNYSMLRFCLWIVFTALCLNALVMGNALQTRVGAGEQQWGIYQGSRWGRLGLHFTPRESLFIHRLQRGHPSRWDAF